MAEFREYYRLNHCLTGGKSKLTRHSDPSKITASRAILSTIGTVLRQPGQPDVGTDDGVHVEDIAVGEPAFV